jgi:membrane-bound lytic murein transglycosylase A
MPRPGRLLLALIVGTLAGCGSVPPPAQDDEAPSGPGPRIHVEQPGARPQAGTPEVVPSGPSAAQAPAVGAAWTQTRSRWVPVPWGDLPGWNDDALGEAWPAWRRSCERAPIPAPAALAAVCADARRLDGATDAARRAWLVERLQAYRVEGLQGETEGLLTGYYEPVAEASRLPNDRFRYPVYRTPQNLLLRKPWYSRQEMDALPEAQAALRGREIAWLADPLAVLNLQIQGSGRLLVTEADGRQKMIRLGYAGTNDQPYRSVGGWLVQQRETRDGSWPTIRQWVAQNPARVQELLWANPRVTFFQEQALTEADSALGPRGAQGVPLTAGRSIAVDPGSIPYGTPVWIASAGQQLSLQRLVIAQDTGSAIAGAVRADYFVGTGPEASALAGRLRQPLRLWVLWPRDAAR